MLRHIIWDFDGTLFDSYPSMAHAMQATLHAHGFEAAYEDIYDLMKESINTAIDHFQERAQWNADMTQEYKALRKKLETQYAQPYAGVPELLRALKQRGLNNYIFTHRGDTLWSMLDKYALRELFVECVTSENGFPSKPAPDAILYLIDKYRMAPQETVMIGDREIDIQSGINAGIRTCAYVDGSGKGIAIADWRASDIAQLGQILSLH